MVQKRSEVSHARGHRRRPARPPTQSSSPTPPDTPTARCKSVTTAPSGFEGEGFPVRRAFAGVSLADLDPFVHMDQMGEVDYGPGEPKGTAWHPHRGFETVTYMIDGIFQHQDSIGGGGLITDGATQWMTAGSGILHIERPPESLVVCGGLFHGIQLWVNLPAASKWTDPRYQDIEPGAAALLSSADGGALVRVIAGEVAGHRGPGSPTPRSPWSTRRCSPGLAPGAALVARRSTPWPTRSAGAARSARTAGPFADGPAGRPRPRGRDRARGRPDPGRQRVGASTCWCSAAPRSGEPVAAYGPFVDEHPGRARPGVRGLPGRPARHHPGRPHRVLSPSDPVPSAGPGAGGRCRSPG